MSPCFLLLDSFIIRLLYIKLHFNKYNQNKHK